MKNDFEPVGRGGSSNSVRTHAKLVMVFIDCEVLIVDHLKRLSYSWSSMGLDFVVSLDVDSSGERDPRSHGAVRLPSGSAGGHIRVQNTAGKTSLTVWSGYSTGFTI